MAGIRHACALATALSAGAGCSTLDGYTQRYGPNPQIAAADVLAVSTRHTEILQHLAIASLGWEPLSLGDPHWYIVAQYGFNYVDEKCDAYLRSIFILDRQRGRIKSGLVLIDKTVGAVLLATDASKEAIEITAQLFGFSASITDVVANSYLFSISPALIFKNVKDAQFAYRNETKAQELTISSRGIAYARIRGYLELCFPQSIESRIENSLAKTTAEAAPPNAGTVRRTDVDANPLIQTVPAL